MAVRDRHSQRIHDALKRAITSQLLRIPAPERAEAAVALRGNLHEVAQQADPTSAAVPDMGARATVVAAFEEALAELNISVPEG